MTRGESIELSILTEGLRFAVDHSLPAMIEKYTARLESFLREHDAAGDVVGTRRHEDEPNRNGDAL